MKLSTILFQKYILEDAVDSEINLVYLVIEEKMVLFNKVFKIV